MSATGLPVFDETLHVTNTWLHELCSRMGWDDRRKGYRLLRHGLHAIRDRLTVAGAAQLSAQLPMLMRGIYFEGWRPGRVPVRTGSEAEFLEDLAGAFGAEPDFDAAAAFREFVDVMRLHVSEGEIEDMRRAMPPAVQGLWAPFGA